jgi:hypothetical protein
MGINLIRHPNSLWQLEGSGKGPVAQCSRFLPISVSRKWGRPRRRVEVCGLREWQAQIRCEKNIDFPIVKPVFFVAFFGFGDGLVCPTQRIADCGLALRRPIRAL